VCPFGTTHRASRAVGRGAFAFNLQSDGQECYTPPPKPKITVTALPSTIDIPGYPELLTNIVGYRATVMNADYADYFVPRGSDWPAQCNRVRAYADYLCNNNSGSATCTSARSAANTCASSQPACATLKIKDNNQRALNYPLYTLEEWNNFFPGGLKVNANWFDINGPPNFPHVSPCTDIFGYSVSNGQVVSLATNGDQVGTQTNLLDALVVIDEQLPDGTTHRSLRIVSNLANAAQRNVRQAVGGFILMQGGHYAPNIPSSVKPDNTGARTGLGLSADGKTLYLVVVQAGSRQPGMTARDLAYYLKAMGASDVINLDNSGSSQMYYDTNPRVTTLPGDKDNQNRDAFRPVPNFFQVKIPQ
jgi:hypothetical protein